MLKKCYNCCEAVAVARCHQCPAEDSFYCSHCKELHTLVKVSKTHTFTDIILICENCECEPASEQCRECSSILEQDSMFCRNCARVHVKIRQFQGHSLDEISNYSNSSLYQGANVEPTSTSTTDDSEHSLRTSGEDGQSAPSPYFSAGIVDPSTLSSWASSWYSDILDNSLNILPDNTVMVGNSVNWRSVGKGFVIAFAVHLVTSLLFGKKSLVFYCIIALFVFALYYKQQCKVQEAIVEVKKESLGIKTTYQKQLKDQKTSPFGANVGLTCDIKKLDKEFPDEFWYNQQDTDQGEGLGLGKGKGGHKQTLLFENIVASKIKKNMGTTARREQSDEVQRNTHRNASLMASSTRPAPGDGGGRGGRSSTGSGGGGAPRVNFLVDALYRPKK